MYHKVLDRFPTKRSSDTRVTIEWEEYSENDSYQYFHMTFDDFVMYCTFKRPKGFVFYEQIKPFISAVNDGYFGSFKCTKKNELTFCYDTKDEGKKYFLIDAGPTCIFRGKK